MPYNLQLAVLQTEGYQYVWPVLHLHGLFTQEFLNKSEWQGLRADERLFIL